MSERPDMTPQPWPEACEPTTDELLPWFLEQSTEAQAWLIDRMRDAASEGRACWMKNHGPRLDHAESRVRDLEAGIRRLCDKAEDAKNLSGWVSTRRLRALVGDEATRSEATP